MLEPRGHFAQSDATALPLADDSVDLVFCSPPYTDARTYGIGAQRNCRDWIDWMLAVVREMTRVSRGLVLVNCAGVTRDRVYQPGPEGLLYEWWKQGGVCWRPAIWNRVGIPGSGGKQWLRADTEYILCFKRDSEWLEWSDNTANGHPPKWAPGGEMSHRLSDGARVNQWGMNKSSSLRLPNGTMRAMGLKEDKSQWVNRRHTKSLPDDSDEIDCYVPPKLANPGNVVELSVDLAGLIDILDRYAKFTQSDAGSVLRVMQRAISTKGVRQWLYGIYATVLGQEILQSSLYGDGEPGNLFDAENVRILREGIREEYVAERPTGGDRGFSGEAFLRDGLQGGGESIAKRTEVGRTSAPRPKNREAEEAARKVREMQCDPETGSSPQGSERDQQLPRESGSVVFELPPERTQGDDLQNLWRSPSVTRILQQALPEIKKVWRSVSEAIEPSLGTDEGANLVKINVGGGMLGHPYAHVNEAPFPVDLAAWFIRSWCKPGGIVLDCFSGSGTTVDAAWREGRRGIGFDLRMSQCQLGARRMREPYAKKKAKVAVESGEASLF